MKTLKRQNQGRPGRRAEEPKDETASRDDKVASVHESRLYRELMSRHETGPRWPGIEDDTGSMRPEAACVIADQMTRANTEVQGQSSDAGEPKAVRPRRAVECKANRPGWYPGKQLLVMQGQSREPRLLEPTTNMRASQRLYREIM